MHMIHMVLIFGFLLVWMDSSIGCSMGRKGRDSEVPSEGLPLQCERQRCSKACLNNSNHYLSVVGTQCGYQSCQTAEPECMFLVFLLCLFSLLCSLSTVYSSSNELALRKHTLSLI